MEGESSRVGLSIRGTGLANLRIVRVSDQPSETVLLINELDLETTLSACVTIPKAKLRGVLKIEIHALSPLSLSELSWGIVTGTQFHEIAIRRVNLGIVCCTFNRQAEIVKTVGAVQRACAYLAGTVDLLIVDNGSNLELPTELRDSRTHMFGQRKLWRCGRLHSRCDRSFGSTARVSYFADGRRHRGFTRDDRPRGPLAGNFAGK